MPGLVSAGNLISFLSDSDQDVRLYALKALDEQIDTLWLEIAPSITQVEALCEDESFSERELASLVAAKVYYHLQEYNESMVFALGAGKRLNLDNGGEFEKTIISKCVDTFIALSSMAKPAGAENEHLLNAGRQDGGAATSAGGLSSTVTPFTQSAVPSKSLLSRPDDESVDATLAGSGDEVQSEIKLVLERGAQERLQTVIDGLFERSYEQKKYRQVIGIAVEAKNLDVLKKTLVRASQDAKGKGSENAGEDLMDYVLDICMSVVPERWFRNEILKLILELLNDLPSPDYFAIAKCVVYLNEHSMASAILRQLVEKGDPRSLSVAYQISFDLYDNSTQEFLRKVRQEISQYIVEESAKPENAASGEQGEEAKETDRLIDDRDESNKEQSSPEASAAFKKISQILEGVTSIRLNMEFLYRANKSNVEILNKIRDSLDARNSLYHSAVTLSNAFMHAATTRDQFFRNNLEWLGKAINWSKFTATAALGVIHRGNLSQGKKLLAPYLPRDNIAGTAAGSVYSQGGSLYAFGLIYANHAGWALDLIREHFNKATEEVIQHGGALGLGAAGMATGNEQIYNDLRNVLLADSAISGDAVGIAMGLVMLGTGNVGALEDIIQYAHETQHDKTIRGCALGMALIVYGRQEGADDLINGLLADPNPTLRYGGILSIAMAYAGTGSNKAVRKLLHVAVSDVNDDVRRIAVMSLGFILFRKHQSVPRMVELLSESYNPHVRYGAAMALGISCAGTGLKDAVDLLEPMLKDSTDFVRQGALIALAMVLVQQNESMNPKVKEIRTLMHDTIRNRHEESVAKFGCALAMGIIDAGGRNCTISLQTQTGNNNAQAIVGAVVFTQYWYWFPLAHFLSLSFTPTAVIGVDQKLEVPVFEMYCRAKPSQFDYPPDPKTQKDEKIGKVKTAVLSTTAQAKRRAAKKGRAKSATDENGARATPGPSGGNDKMDIDEPTKEGGVDADSKGTEAPAEEAKEEAKEETKEAPKTPTKDKQRKQDKDKVGYTIENMSRVLPGQLQYLSFPSERYVPVKRPTGGILVVHDTKPEEPRETIELKSSTSSSTKPAPTAGQQPADQNQMGMLTLSNGERVHPLEALARARYGISLDQLAEEGEEQEEGAEAGAAAGAGVGGAAGAAAAAGVLTAVDEDEEGGEDAPVPGAFDYESDNENGQGGDAMEED